MELKTMPKRTAAELLAFLAENESFDSLSTILNDSITAVEAKAVLRELAVHLHQQAAVEDVAPVWSKNPHLSRKAKQVISCLSSTEEKALMKVFGISE